MSPLDADTPLGNLEGAPMSLAEEIAAEVKDGIDVSEHYESLKKGDTHITALQKLSMQELVEL
ncbi:MAG: hypothetical protein HQ464_14330, partial [Planctomycetes bacterium]|nr:hypothetical protein [Planctomycetota bacterium]